MTDYSEMTWVEIEERLKETKIVVFPTGSVEQHGHHLGVGADWLQADEIARRVGEKSGAIVLPTLCYGVSGHHKEFPGVLTMTFGTYKQVIFEILESLNRYGVEKVVFMNGHGGNAGAIVEAAKEARDRFGMLCAVTHWWDILKNESIHGHTAEQHAGYAETALTLASRPEAVRMEKAIVVATRQVDPEIQLTRAGLARFKNGIVRIPLRVIDVTDTGSMTETHPDDTETTSDYSMITPEYSEELMEKVVDWLCEFIPRFESLTLPQATKRYP
ncbi:MAG: creatininase family protein [Candidatus Bathyarchaeota archaeon]|nr:creatininase family protein [Candidatus Bathyarchaeota archaeon]